MFIADSDQAIVVVAQRVDQDMSTATKTSTPLKDVPQAVSVVTAADIADQGMRSITDVLRAVPGATVASGEGHRDQILLRGQNTTADFFADGIRDDVQYYRGLYNLDRVEVLKGPNAMIFGRGGGGGIVNRVRKMATSDTFAAGSAIIDAFAAGSAAVDLNVAFAPPLAGRLNAAYETFDSFRDHVGGRRIGINPTLAWTPSEASRIDLTYEYSRDRRVVDRGIPSLNGRPLDGARRDFFGDPEVNRLRFDAHVLDAKVEHRFGNVLQLTTRARYGHYDKFYRNSLAATAVTASDTVGMEAYQSRSERAAFYLQNDFVAKISTGPLQHTLLVGADYGRQDSFADRQQGFFDSAGKITRLFVPVGSADRLPTITFRDSAVRRATAADTLATAVGLYVQDQIEIGRHVEFVAGLRRDWFKLDYADQLSPLRLTRQDALWSPRLGLVLKPDERLSLYASWSTSFLPQSGDQFSSLTPSTAGLKPEKFVNREIGAKWSPTRGFDVTLAAYILNRTNTRANDPVTGDVVLTGEQRSKGIEASAQGKLSERLSMSAAVALQRAEITRTTASAPAGREVASVPHFTASLWGRYDFTDRIGLGFGLYHQSKFYASISNAVTVPGFTRADAAAFFGLTPGLELQLNLENLFNENYIGLTQTDNNLTPGSPRSLKAGIRFKL